MKPNDRNTKAPKIQERDVSKTCVEYMVLRGWDAVRINPGPYGKGGIADYLFLHYQRKEIIWTEFKNPRAKPACRCDTVRRGKCTFCLQAEWTAKVRAMGGTVLRVSNIESFFQWYEARYGVEGQMRLGGAA